MTIYLLFAHLIFAVLITFIPILVTIHVYLVTFFGIYLVIMEKNANRIVILISYVVGSELLWRAFNAGIYWEYVKMLSIIFLLIIGFRLGFNRLNHKLGIIYVLLLLPSILVVQSISQSDLTHALLGPILLGISVTVFSALEINSKLFKDMLVYGTMPILSFLLITMSNTISEGSFNFISAYLHRIETGGIGPNQASNILGLGALFSFILTRITIGGEKTIFHIVGITTIVQTILTHSRGGFWNTVISILIFYLFELTASKSKVKLLGSALVIITTFYFILFPYLDDISGGSIVNRFSDNDLTSREIIIESEILAYKKNPIFGIGPGESRKFRLEQFGSYQHSHTEFTRLLAEHGIFGLISLIILFLLALSIIKNKKEFDRSISITLLSWSLLFMIHSATRLAAPCFLFGFAFSKFSFNQMGEHK